MQTTTITPTGDSRIDPLLGTQKWASGAITYSFPGATSTWSSEAGEYGAGGTSEPTTGFAALDASAQTAVISALGAWAAVANLSFSQVADNASGHGTLRFAWSTLDASLQAESYQPGTSDKAGDTWLSTAAPWSGFAAGSYDYSTLLHEIGHALGLSEPSAAVNPLLDGYRYTLMSGNADPTSIGSWVDFEPTTPMLSDILAIQSLYGANTAYHAGDDTYTYTQGERYFETIWDGGGTDTLVWNATTQGASIDLGPGLFSSLGEPLTYYSEDLSSSWSDARTVAIAVGAQIENATGGGASDALIGNALDNVLAGGGGNDTIDGHGGVDTAAYSGASTRYDLGFSSVTHRWTLTDGQAGADGVDTLEDVERLQFTDKTVTIESRSPVDLLTGQPATFAGLPADLYKYFIIAFGAAPGVSYMEQMAAAYTWWLPVYGANTVPTIVDVFTTKEQFTDVYQEALYRAEGSGAGIRYYHYHHDAGQLVRDVEVSKTVFDQQMNLLAQKMIEQIVKDAATPQAKAEAVADIGLALGLGGDWTIGRVIYQIFGNLSNKTPADGADWVKWGGTATQFSKEIAVAQYYTETMEQSTTDLAVLRDVMTPVTQDSDVSSEAAIVQLIGDALLAG